MTPFTPQGIAFLMKELVNDMLILNRKIDESIILDDHIEIKILEIQDGRVKIGVEAPKNVSVLRKEVYDAVIEENRKSLEVDVDLLDLFKNK